MAILKHESGEVISDFANINQLLAPIGVEFSQWPIPESAELAGLLNRDALSDEEKENVLVGFESYFNKLKEEEGYQSRDLIVLHPEVPGLDDLLKKFDRCHTHDDDEVRYIVAGEGVFGFILDNEKQVLLTVQAGEYIRIPKDVEHWFVLTPEKRIKAIRYFTGMDGWVPNYTDRNITVN